MLGVSLGSSVVSSIGYEDDVGLLANNLSKIAGLLLLTTEYCQQFHVELVPDKTKLLVFAPPKQNLHLYLHKLCNPTTMFGKQLDLC